MKKILIIEDDLFIRENVCEVLELSGYDAYSASNGKEGLELAFEILPDLIICDIMMPMMDGYEVRQKLIENMRTKTIPFVFLTAKTDIKELRHGMSLGADDYITKPFEVKDLLNSINLRFEKIDNLKDLFRIENISEVENIPQIVIKSDDASESISPNEIVIIRSSGKYSEIIRSDDEKFAIQKDLKFWEVALPENNFLRVHSSVIINTNYLKSVEKTVDDKYVVYMKNYEEPIFVGARHWNKLKHLIN